MSELDPNDVPATTEKSEAQSWFAPDEALFAIDYYLQIYLFDRDTKENFYKRVLATRELAPDEWEPQQLAYLLRAAYFAYRRLIGIERAGWPEPKQDIMVYHLGELISNLERYFKSAQSAELSVERLLVLASAMEAGPVEVQRGLAMLGDDDRAASIERAIKQLHDGVPGHETAIVLLAIYLPDDRREEVIRNQIAASRREDLRLTLFKLLNQYNQVPILESIKPIFSHDTTELLVRRGLTDPAPRVRQQAVIYSVGLGLAEALHVELQAGVNDLDAPTKEVFLSALACLNNPRPS